MIEEDEKASTRHNNYHVLKIGPFSVTDLKGHFITIDGNGIENTIPMEKVSYTTTEGYLTKKITSNLRSSSQVTSPRKE